MHKQVPDNFFARHLADIMLDRKRRENYMFSVESAEVKEDDKGVYIECELSTGDRYELGVFYRKPKGKGR